MHWKIIFGVVRLLFWAAVAWMLLRKADAQHPASVHGDGRIEFGRNGYAYVAWTLFVLGLGWSSTRDLIASTGSPYKLVNGVGFGLLALLLLFAFPGTIVVTSDGLEEVYWLRRNKRIQWKDIVEINTGEKILTVTVTSADGTKIVHSAQLADRARFLLELKQYCGENLPPDFPREPTISTVNQS